MPTTTAPIDIAALESFANELADMAVPASLELFRHPLDIERKEDSSPVTIADKRIESILREAIAGRYPDHGIFGEEHGAEHLDRRHVWVVDPIDGTKSFISGWPLFGTLIACLEDGKPVVGVISMPAIGERWSARRGGQARFAGKPCAVSRCTRLAEARIYTTSPDAFDEAERALYLDISSRAALRRFGGDCYSYGLLASGHVDAVIEMQLQPYDYMALVPVIEAAGGVITDWNGQPLTLDSPGRVVAAATPELHAELLALLGADAPARAS
ncbi:histidinol-phosphatase [Pontibaca methylaminivorans]|uniref:histidinol-phosphatase n=1 Tax=Pontibaca methylaminivorans TaxID=515897 RepID=UPI002FDA21DF